jgi:hypothetical protein
MRPRDTEMAGGKDPDRDDFAEAYLTATHAIWVLETQMGKMGMKGCPELENLRRAVMNHAGERQEFEP